jgi:protein involved in polysaccharide export with SLBB domain
MRGTRCLLAGVAALALASCARQQQDYAGIDGGGTHGLVASASGFDRTAETRAHDGRPPALPSTVRTPTAAHGSARLFSASPAYAQQAYAEPDIAQPLPPQAEGGRGLFNSRPGPARADARPAGQAYVLQYHGARDRGLQAVPQPVASHDAAGGPYVAAPEADAATPAVKPQPYTLDAGDKLRVVVFGQAGISNSYLVDDGGHVSLPLIGVVPARGLTTQQLSQRIAARLRQGYVREPHVSVEVERYRPFFILGEVTNPGQYSYVANMTAETAVAIAGGFAPRAFKQTVDLTRATHGQQVRAEVPISTPVRPGDTVVVKERWF